MRAHGRDHLYAGVQADPHDEIDLVLFGEVTCRDESRRIADHEEDDNA